jgi:DNA (cytosine-5)-methyltransferase 3A
MAGGGNPTRKRDIGYSFGKILHQEQIRKLTPTECLRLQSMPDDYFDKAIYKGKPISNTQRYKMCGNAFNKEVIVHILKTLWS